MDKIDKDLYNKEFDKMFKLDRDGAMTNIDCYVNNLEVKINNLNKGIDELIIELEEHINYCQNDSQGVNDICNLSISFEIKLLDKLKKLKGE